MMKKYKILNVAILIIGIAAVICFGIVFAENRTFGGTAQKMIGYVVDNSAQVMFEEDASDNLLEDWLKGTVGDTVQSLSEEYLSAIQGLLVLFRAGFLLPALLAGSAVIVVWVMKARYRYLIAVGLSVAGAVSFPVIELVAVPLCISGHLQSSGLLDWVSDEVNWLQFCKIAGEFLDPICWAGFSLLLILALCCVAGFVVEAPVKMTEYIEQEEQQEEAAVPVLRGLAGAYSGGTITLQPGETVLLGSDAAACNIILEGEDVSPRHCSVVFDRKQNLYLVTDMSQKGTYTNGSRRLAAKSETSLERNSLLVLGSDENIFMLE